MFLDPRSGEPWNEERAYRRSYWTPALKALGIRYRKAVQHAAHLCDLLLMQGLTPAFCARQLGHSVEMFLRTYSKWLEGDRDDMEMGEARTSLLREETGEE